MDRKTVRLTLSDRFLDVKGYVFPTVGLAVTPDTHNLGFNVTHIRTGWTVNSIPQTKDRCLSFVRGERDAGRDWNEVDADNSHKWTASHDGLLEKIRHDLCRRWSVSTARRRKVPLTQAN